MTQVDHSRRATLRLLGTALAASALPGCVKGIDGVTAPTDTGGWVTRLAARPSFTGATALATGTVLALGAADVGAGAAPGSLYLPRSAAQGRAVPLLIHCHGAGSNIAPELAAHLAAAEAAGVAVLAPLAARSTWDVIAGLRSDDAARIDRLLGWLFARVAVDVSRIALSGFSDGATYALALGRVNGDLVRGITAHAPGYALEVQATGRPPVTLVHGTGDLQFPIAATSRRIRDTLATRGYPVSLVEFEGGHALHRPAVEAAVAALAA